MQKFDSSILSMVDGAILAEYVGLDRMHKPNIVLAPEGEPYLYRWHLHHNNKVGNHFFHIQVQSDPERPMHDHPWDNFSVILVGGYDETYEPYPHLVPKGDDGSRTSLLRCLRKGQTCYRPATVAHRLVLPPDIPYTMTLFSTGPKLREWGFWYPDGFHHNKRHVDDRPSGISFGRHEQ